MQQLILTGRHLVRPPSPREVDHWIMAPTALQAKNLREISVQNGIALVIDETNVDMLESTIDYHV